MFTSPQKAAWPEGRDDGRAQPLRERRGAGQNSHHEFPLSNSRRPKYNSRPQPDAIVSGQCRAAGASATASLAYVPTWYEDFRKDLGRIDVPTLVIHGDADRILPITATGLRTAKLIKGARQSVVKDGPHGITWTHAEEVNSELANFLGKGAAQRAASAPQHEAVA
jgi:pimeloyl-ACP methyl ester carboxylesterase